MPQAATWSGLPAIKGRSETTRMVLLTFCLVGLQVTWGIEMTYGTPYLLSLGLSKSSMSAVWIAGPLSGLIVQPLIGVIADSSRSKWGRRRPFILVASFVVAACLLVMGWSEEIVDTFIFIPETKPWWRIIVAVGSIYAIDFSINVVMCSSRSLIVDTLPMSKQQLGNAWASRMAAIGHIFSYAIGCIDLRATWGDWLGNSQFKQLCIIAAVSIILGSIVTCYCVTERILISAKEGKKSKGAWGHLKTIFKTTTNLPPKIRAICWVQFFTWIGWFPFLFYSPTWVGETYFQYSAPDDLPDTTDELAEIGIIGSRALVVFSIITFLASVVSPFLVRSPGAAATRTFTARPHPMLAPILRALEGVHVQKPDLVTAWMLGNIVFAVLMLLTPLVRSVTFASFLVACTGIPWAIAGWAPFALLGVEVNRLAAPTPSLHSGRSTSFSSGTPLGGGAYLRPSMDAGPSPPGSPKALHLKHLDRPPRGGMLDPDENSDAENEDDDAAKGLLRGGGGGGGGVSERHASTGEMAGIYLGVLNVFTTLPQFLGTFTSMIVFALLEPGVSQELEDQDDESDDDQQGVNAIAVCLCIGGASALMGAYATRWLRTAK